MDGRRYQFIMSSCLTLTGTKFSVPTSLHSFLSELMGISLTCDDVEQITERTEGCLVGLQLLALSLQGQFLLSEALTHASGRYILDYLTKEVLRQQPEPLQAFLLVTSLLDQFCASHCDALWEEGRSQQMLETLEQMFAQEREAVAQVRALLAEQKSTQEEKRTGKQISSASRAHNQALIDPLSTREQEVLEVLAQGASNQEVADALVIAPNTVKRHVQVILEKLGVRNRTQAVIRAQQLDLLTNQLIEAS